MPRLEWLEPRHLPSASPVTASIVLEKENNDTLDVAQNLGSLDSAGTTVVRGVIGNSPAGAADVDWFSFQLDNDAHVVMDVPPNPANGEAPVLSVWNSAAFDPNDPASQLGHRLIAQDNSSGSLDQLFTAGTYYVAVSGAGNRYFSPFLADSGYAGATGSYTLTMQATDLTFAAGDGPIVLAADPPAGSTLSASPLSLRFTVSTALDPTTLLPGDTVRLVTNPNGTFGDGNDQDVPLASANFLPNSQDVLVTPDAPLSPGYYEVILAGNGSVNPDVVTDVNGIPLGTDAAHTSGQDYTTTFQVNGVEGNTAPGAGADDTAATAHDLGNITGAGVVQVSGTIGDDPTDPVPFDPASVDLYHVQISGPGQFAFAAEVFARRLGSPLNPAVSLFQLDPSNGQLELVAADDNTANNTRGSDGRSLPLTSDSAIFAGLTAGDYWIGVSSSPNVADPANGVLPGQDGVYDPNISHSGQVGDTTGPYVLNVLVYRDNQAPQVVTVTPAPETVLNAPPQTLTVQFNKNVNLQELAFNAFEQTNTGALPSVEVVGGPNNTVYYPRLLTYDPTTYTATFQLLDALPNGSYQLRMSGGRGLTDFAGNSLIGNDPSDDYVVSFAVNAPVRGTGTMPLTFADQEPNDTLIHAQILGALFPHDLQTGVTVVRNFSSSPATTSTDVADYYQFSVAQSQTYSFLVSGTFSGKPTLHLFDSTGKPIKASKVGTSGSLLAQLTPGTYVIEISGWSVSTVRGSYQLKLVLQGASENPPPLTVGPAPVLRVLLAGAPVPPTPTPTPVVKVSLPPLSNANTTPGPSGASSPRVGTASTSSLTDFVTALGIGTIGGAASASGAMPPTLDSVTLGLVNPSVVGLSVRRTATNALDGGNSDNVNTDESDGAFTAPGLGDWLMPGSNRIQSSWQYFRGWWVRWDTATTEMHPSGDTPDDSGADMASEDDGANRTDGVTEDEL